MKRLISLWSFIFIVVLNITAQAPTGYYSDADGTCGASLKTALYKIITSHTVRTYSQLWTDFQTTDVREDGKVWDIYSGVTNYTFISDQCTNYSSEGDCYNREHSFPKSWFNDEYPMYTDLFHLYPSDGYVNGRRSNYPFGETSKPTYTSQGGYCKLGPSSVKGYTGTVFEPKDDVKGDLARAYFYMATCYEDKIAGWSSPMLAGNNYPAFASWALDMLLRWAAEDPVSQREIDRNNAVYQIQKNRNPFIDCPGLEQYIWGNKMDVIFDSDNYDQGGGGIVTFVEEPVFYPAGGEVLKKGMEIAITCATSNSYIVYSINGGEEITVAAPARIEVGDEDLIITAYAKAGDKVSEKVTAQYTVEETPGLVEGECEMKKVMTTADIVPGDKYAIVCETHSRAMGAADDDIRTYADVTIENGVIVSEVNTEGKPYVFVLGGTDGNHTFYDAAGDCYLALNSNGNKLHFSSHSDSDNTSWIISVNAGNTTIGNKAYATRFIQYNASSPRFACYESTQKPVVLYRVVKESTDIEKVQYDDRYKKVNVYSISGILIRKNVRKMNALDGLLPGIYIVDGKKVSK